MREDAWLAGRLGRPAFTWAPGEDTAVPAGAFAQAKVPCADVETVSALEDAGFRVVDVNVTLERPAGGLGAPAGVDVGEATARQAGALLDIAGRAFTFSRFHLDPRIPDTTADAIKREWIRSYLDGVRGDRLLAASVGGQVAGFLAQLGNVIDLIAVDAPHRGSGAGRALVAALAGGPIVVGTQAANLASLAFYGALGFTVIDTKYVLHLHA